MAASSERGDDGAEIAAGLPQPADWSSSGWRCARLLCGATERADGVTEIEVLAVDVTAPRPKVTPRAVVREQSQRFNRERVWIVDSDE